ncbi:hypothetical protein FACUT_10752 [Fusarium acutatum]|uniref:Uncharacterized protein n=1 Tax=Fusarium acutatum TaxID=78861 RepID=A0A8H4JF24_9HYPO|nr:hypothetical protein FACUT_10752 [Fusarium acutatum]
MALQYALCYIGVVILAFVSGYHNSMFHELTSAYEQKIIGILIQKHEDWDSDEDDDESNDEGYSSGTSET